jgi:mRNA-degrading endonuclease RelE of RelBE toxin-antitoxin system
VNNLARVKSDPASEFPPMQRYSLVYAAAFQEHLREIEPKHHSLIQSKIEEQLLFEPDRKSKNRKPLMQPVDFGATWELRFGPGNRFRVFYEIDPERHEVNVLAIGVKVRNRLQIGGEEVNV